MTVIAFFEDLGIAVSDVMLSVDGIGGGIALPSVGDPSFIAPPLPVTPTRLVRKFVRVSRPGSDGMFLTCGTVSHIKKLTKMIKQIVAGKVAVPPTLATRLAPNSVASLVDVAAEMVEQAGSNQFELLGMVDNKRYARHFDTPNLVHHLPYWGKVVAFGSGAPYLVSWLQEKGNAYLDDGLNGDTDLQRALRGFNTIPSQLLEEDTRSMLTLREGVGGYYECFAITSNSLTVDDKVLTVFVRFKRGNPTPVVEIRRIFFHHYDNDLLVVGSLAGGPFTVSPAQPLKVPLENFMVFEIPPLQTEKPASKWTNPSRLAQLIESAESLRLTTYRGPQDESLRRFHEGKNGRRLVTVTVKKDKLKIEVNESDLLHFYGRTDSNVPLE